MVSQYVGHGPYSLGQRLGAGGEDSDEKRVIVKVLGNP
jgi:hypothetical protein